MADILVHPEDDPRDPNACRLYRRRNLPAADWPWIRITGYDLSKVPPRDSDISGWVPQEYETLGAILGQAKQPLASRGQTYEIPG